MLGNFEDVIAVLSWLQSLLDARVEERDDESDCMAVDGEGGAVRLYTFSEDTRMRIAYPP